MTSKMIEVSDGFVTKENLEKCPFCGGEAGIYKLDVGVPYPGWIYFVDCIDGCFEEIVMSQKGYVKDEEEICNSLRKRWNKRK